MLDGQTSTNRPKHGKTAKVEIEGCVCDQCVCVCVCVCGVCEGHMAEIFEPWASAKVVLASAFHDGCSKSERLK